jgi:hypothetical protein
MGVSVMYSAIPPSSTLYKKLQHDKALGILVSDTFTYGGGTFSFFEISPDEIDEILESVVDAHPDVFDSKRKAEQAIAEFRAEINRTRQVYPGIENRTAMIEKSVDKIEQCLLQQFTQRQVKNAQQIIGKLLFGDRSATLNSIAAVNSSIDLISRDLVREGASLLGPIDPETLYTGEAIWDDWGLDHFKRWRSLYLAADEKGEEILVGAG